MDDLNIDSAIVNQFKIDFVNDKLNYAKRKSGLKTELISRAMGSGKCGLNILDLSAGLAVDAIFLSQMGYQVTSLERNKIIFKKLHEAWLQLPDAAKEKIQFIFSDAKDYLLAYSNTFDVIYFDPMFPEKKKSALPKKEMVIFRSLVGDDHDATSVLELALQKKNIKRVVVKRPLKAEWLLRKPSHQLLGKLIRFDIYGVTK